MMLLPSLGSSTGHVILLVLAAVGLALAAAFGWALRSLRRDADRVGRLNRALRTISDCNQALMHARDEEQLLSQVCDAIVNTGGYPFVWVGYAEQDASRTVRPMAVAGARREDAEALGVTWSDTECGRGPTGAAIRMGRPVITRDIAGDQVFDPWREAVVKFGVASSIALPLSARGQVFGALTIYATHVDAFDAAEVALLTELVDDLAYGIEALRTQAAHEGAQKALEASERQLALVLNNVSDVVFTIAVESDGGFHFAWVNHRFLDLTGLSEDQIIGARVQDVIPEPALTMVVGKYREAIETGRPAHWEEASEYPAGRRIGQVTVVPALDSSGTCSQLVGVVHDVTEREEAARALEESERQYRELVENANSIILRWARDGRVTFLNEFGQKFFGYSSDEIVGRHVMDTIVPATDTAGRDMAELMEEILSDPVAFEQSVNENMRRDGQSVWISWTNRIVCDADGEVSEILSVGTDITARRRAEQAIRDLNATLEQRVAERTAELAVAKDRAEAADRVKSAFLATMSHELRTPLNSIIGFTGIMLQKLAGPLTAEQSKQLGMVRDSSRHLLALINDVLDISKIEAGQLQVSREHFDLPGTIKKAVATVAPLAEKKGLDLRIEVAPEIGDMLSDPRRIEQVLLNLLNNAIKFTDDGVVTLTADIVPGASPAAPSTIRIAVADTGIGIRAEDMGQLFQSFRQIDTGLARQHEGTGLGLSICRRLAELLGGEMNAASELGTGSVFTLTLPAEGLVEA